jgi:hypothetical protein
MRSSEAKSSSSVSTGTLKVACPLAGALNLLGFGQWSSGDRGIVPTHIAGLPSTLINAALSPTVALFRFTSTTASVLVGAELEVAVTVAVSVASSSVSVAVAVAVASSSPVAEALNSVSL